MGKEKKVLVTLQVQGEYDDYATLELNQSEYRNLTKILNLINLQIAHVNISIYDTKLI